MNPNEVMSHSDQTLILVTGSIVVLLILGGFIWWLNYNYEKRNKKSHNPHRKLVTPPNKPHGVTQSKSAKGTIL